MRLSMQLVATLVLSVFGTLPARAEYPERAITLVVPFAAGAITDISSRIIAKALSAQLGQPIVIENKVGAGGIVGMQYVANARPDGYTLVVGANGILATFPSLYQSLSYNVPKDFAPIHGFALSPLVMTVAANKPYKTLAEFAAYAKASPRPLKYSSSGMGTNAHFASEMFASDIGVKMTHVPYKSGTTGATVDMQSGEIDLVFDFSVTAKPLIEEKRVRPLLVTAPTRLPSLPDVPTATEAGYPRLSITSWSAMMAPAGTSPDVINRLIKGMAAAMKDPEVIKYYETTGSIIMDGYSGEKLGKFIADETVKFRDLIALAKLEKIP